MSLIVNNLKVKIDQKTILQGIDLRIEPGELVAIMGPNGSGKSTLAYTLAGHPQYLIKSGTIILDGFDITQIPADQKAKAGLFLGLQYPMAVAGVNLNNFLRLAYQNIKGKKIMPFEFREKLLKEAKGLNFNASFFDRSVNEGFSGGEKKKSEILQLLILQPKYAILDEIDSGLDIDALKLVAAAIIKAKKTNSKMGILLITHYQRILNYLQPDRVIVMKAGKIVKSGGKELVAKLEQEGYENF